MFFNKKKEFIIYTDDQTIKRNPLIFGNNKYYFDDNGYLNILLKSETHIFYSCNKELIYNFSDTERIYYVYREDNDCHFNILVKDIDKK